MYYQEFYPDQGWVASWKVPSDSTKALQVYVRHFTDNSVDSMLVKNLINRVNKWVKKGIKVYTFRPPTTSAVVLENRMSDFDENAFIESFEKVGGQWIHIPVAGFVSYDGNHLEKESALKLSSRLGKIISRKNK